ncbi:hypothetical protein OGATHE_005620 [Ogataea polymorpha]|uniref:Uncharacterized protein n=1 Tax=Ogataea polymorpha TaxID=460523 RepID=A0A9P8NU49_9ASCO|nr:hypothetical protein OGATHE_005620 [Ogataea polymorpha]
MSAGVVFEFALKGREQIVLETLEHRAGLGHQVCADEGSFFGIAGDLELEVLLVVLELHETHRVFGNRAVVVDLDDKLHLQVEDATHFALALGHVAVPGHRLDAADRERVVVACDAHLWQPLLEVFIGPADTVLVDPVPVVWVVYGGHGESCLGAEIIYHDKSRKIFY